MKIHLTLLDTTEPLRTQRIPLSDAQSPNLEGAEMLKKDCCLLQKPRLKGVCSNFLALVLLLPLVGVTPLGAWELDPGEIAEEPLSWAFSQENRCQFIVEGEVRCGTYGTFYFGDSLPDDSCAEEGPPYIRRSYTVPPALREIAPILSRTIGRKVEQAISPLESPTIAVIDYFEDSPHGSWVVTLIGEILPHADFQEYALDSPHLPQIFGTKANDSHLLANLCAIREETETGPIGTQKPEFLNLSIGRHALTEDPSAHLRCDAVTQGLQCHIANLIDWLNADHPDHGRTLTLAAAGNHGFATFPATLPSTLSVGASDVAALRARQVVPLHESGQRFDALIPGQNLCPMGFATPFGTSFSTAFLTGALASVEVRPRTPMEESIAIRWKDDCFALTVVGADDTRCLNWGASRLLSGLVDAARGACWRPADTRYTKLDIGPAIDGEPSYPPLQLYNARVLRPQPEGGYCVPCTGGMDDDGFAGPLRFGDLTVNLIETPSFPDSVELHEIYYRYSDGDRSVYHRVETSEEFLEDFKNGDYESITLDSVAVPTDLQPSLEFVTRITGKDCADPSECPRTSVPILIER